MHKEVGFPVYTNGKEIVVGLIFKITAFYAKAKTQKPKKSQTPKNSIMTKTRKLDFI